MGFTLRYRSSRFSLFRVLGPLLGIALRIGACTIALG